MVNGTAGTTVMGAFDPIDELADICERHGNIWLHIDACWGGAALLSPKLKYVYLMSNPLRCPNLRFELNVLNG